MSDAPQPRPVGLSGVSPWRELDEEDLLYCVVFSGEGQPHTNEPYCATMPYERRMFYGDGTFALAYSALRKCLGPDFGQVALVEAKARFTARLYVGDRIRTHFRPTSPGPHDDAGPAPVLDANLSAFRVEVENQAGAIAFHADLILRVDPAVRRPTVVEAMTGA